MDPKSEPGSLFPQILTEVRCSQSFVCLGLRPPKLAVPRFFLSTTSAVVVGSDARRGLTLESIFCRSQAGTVPTATSVMLRSR